MDKQATRKRIGAKLKELRIKAGYSNYEYFAFDHGLNKQTVGRAETGKNITIDTLISLLVIFKVTPEEFFKGIK